MLEQVILAGPNSDPSNTDPYCFDECGPDGLGEYDVDECVSCYKVSKKFMIKDQKTVILRKFYK